MRATAIVGLCVTALALAATGCGSSDTSAEEAWAGTVCSAVSTWKTAVSTVTTDATAALTQPGATRADLETAIDDGVAATKTLVDDLKAAVPPDTAEGQQAKADVNAFLDDAQTALDEVQTAVAAIPDGADLQTVITQLSGLATSLQAAITSGQQLVTTLDEIGGDIRSGFENADACQDLR